MMSFWEIEEIKSKISINDISDVHINEIGRTYWGDNLRYYKEDFYGTIFKGEFNEGVLQYIFSSKKGFFIKKDDNYNNKGEYLYIDKKGHPYKVKNNKIGNYVFSPEIKSILEKYAF
jgi:hypothetical protein